MLQTPSRASTASSSSYQALSRQNTMSSYDGSRSARQSKRYSMSALYMSMSAQETDLEIEDDLAKGMSPTPPPPFRAEALSGSPLTYCSQLKRYFGTSSPRSPPSPRRTSCSKKMCGTSTLGSPC